LVRCLVPGAWWRRDHAVGGRERGAPLGAQATPVTSAVRRAPSGAVRGQDPPRARGARRFV